MVFVTKPDFENAVYAASWPHRIDSDGKDYYIFQLLNDAGLADPVFYRDMALDGSEHIMLTVVKAYMGRRKLKVFLAPKSEGSMRVASVELGPHIG